MGLSIHAYAKPTLIQEKTGDIECLYEWAEVKDLDGFSPFCNDSFPKQCEGIVEGWYTYEDSMHVLSRSYSGWSNLRESLAKVAGYKPNSLSESRPHQVKVFSSDSGVLHELICFSDCEGVINTKCCTKIYEDLLTISVTELNPFDEDSYYKLLQGFKFASENEGVVTFG